MVGTPVQEPHDAEKGVSSRTSIVVSSLQETELCDPRSDPSVVTIPATQPPASPPILLQDGGLRAWLQVLGSFVMYFNVWGYTFAFGSFQNYYESDYLYGTSPSAIAWIGSIQAFLLVLSGVFAGPLFDLGYFHVMIVGGASLATFGAFMLSLSTLYWQIFLAQGICVGLGNGMLFVPSIALVTRSFDRNRSLAVGMMSCGAPIGGVIYAFLFERLLPQVGFAWTARSMGFFMLGTYIVALPLILWRATNTGDIGVGTRRKLIDKAALTDLPFWCFTASASFLFLAYLTPFIYMPTYAQTKLGSSQSYASYVLAISQGASVPGRIAAAIAANQIGVMTTWSVYGSLSAVMCFVWMTASTSPRFIVFCALYGCFSGALIPLPPSVFPVVCPDASVIGTRFGMAQAITSFTNLVGPPIGGALLKTGRGGSQNWLALQAWCGAVLLWGVVCLAMLWVVLVKKRHTKILI